MNKTMSLKEQPFNELLMDKKCTIRNGKRDINLGELKFRSVESGREMATEVTHVINCLLKNVPEDHVLNDGFANHEDMFEQMKEYYPQINPESEVTVIVFNPDQASYWAMDEESKLLSSIKK